MKTPKIIKLMMDTINPDDPREFIHYICSRDGFLHATNAHLLVKTPTDSNKGFYLSQHDKLYEIIPSCPVVTKAPNFEKLFDFTTTEEAEINDTFVSEFIYHIFTKTNECFDIKYLSMLFDYSHRWTLKYSKDEDRISPIILERTEYSGDVTALLMPIKID